LIFEGPTPIKQYGPYFSIMGCLAFKMYANSRIRAVSVARATIHFGIAPPEVLFMARALNKKCQGRGKEAPFGVAL
jgi:hypothetical protein